MDTVVTLLSGEWTDLTAIWAAATPPAADGETITVQPADAGDAHAIVIAQADAAPSGRAGHLVAGGALLHCTMSTGRTHYGRAYFDDATVIATGAGAG